MVTLEHYVEPQYQISGTGKAIIGKTPVMLQLFDYLNRLTNVPATVLLQGETGTGKELFAQALHHNGTRSTTGPLVVVNCAQIPSELLESILFGHVRGAFTGAIKDARGVFRTADRGTLFLDEISEMSFPLQAKILRALQEGEVQPVGAARVEKVDVRVVAATNKDLRGEVKAGRFREDLYYRLSVAPIRIPPLRERREDIPLLAEYILNRLNLKYTATATGFSRQALEALSQKEWNGNIRELENVIEHAFVIESGNIITPASLPSSVTGQRGLNDTDDDEEGSEPYSSDVDDGEGDEIMAAISVSAGGLSPINVGGKGFVLDINRLDFQANKEEFERQFLISALTAFKGRINQTALHANIPKKTLLRKLQKYGITARDYSGKP